MDGYIKQSGCGWFWVGRDAGKFNGSGHYKQVIGLTKLIGWDTAEEAAADMQKKAPGCAVVTEKEYYAEATRRLEAHRAAIQAARATKTV